MAFARSILIALTLAAAPHAQAQESVAAFYRGKTIAVVIPSAVGGGYDLYGRLVARHIGRFIPGNPSATPVNMPGAGGVIATQYVYAAGAKDGTVIGETYPAALMEQVIGSKSQIKYDARRFNYIGSVSTDTFRVCYVGGKSGVTRFEDAFEREIVMGGSGVGSPSTDYPIMYNNLLGTKFKVVSGYGGTGDINLAIDKGELQGTCGQSYPVLATTRPEWLASGAIRLIADENLKAHKETAALNLPVTPSFAKTHEAKETLDFIFSLSSLGRPFIMAPEVPADRVAALRDALAAMVKDAEFLGDAGKMKADITDPMTGEEFETTIQRLLATPPDGVERVKQATVPKK